MSNGEGAQNPGERGIIHFRGVEHKNDSAHIRVILELDHTASYRCNTLSEDPSKGLPSRIYLDLSNTRCPRELQKIISFQDGPLKAVRIGQYDKNTTRVVLDVSKVEEYKIITLSSPDRIVIDLWKDKVIPSPDSKPPSAASEGEMSNGLTQGPSGTGPPKQPSPVHDAEVSNDETQAPSDMEPPKTPSAANKRETPNRPTYLPRIVIDPGHGGDDPGAVGKCGLMEKDVALRLAKLLKASLDQGPMGAVFLTRTRDVRLSLGRRTALANAKKADIFISIHANGHNDRSVSGIETYYLDNTTDKAAIRLAALENASSGHKPNDLQRILMDLRRNSNVLESNALAHIVQESLVGELAKRFHGVIDNGAKANLFYVLMGADMPSILVEVSYISNPEEEKRLQNKQYLQRIADGIQKGIKQYFANQYLPTLRAQKEPSVN
jgi:N-acetylmuramoyl-L-alanine amidase